MRKWIRIKPAIWITFIPAKMHKNQPAITFVYYSRSVDSGKRKQRVSSDIEEKILGIAGERTIYGYRRV